MLSLKRKLILSAIVATFAPSIPVIAYAGALAADSLPGSFYANNGAVSYTSASGTAGVINVPTGNTILQWGTSTGLPGTVTAISAPAGVITNPGFSVGSGAGINIGSAGNGGNVLIVDASGNPSEIDGALFVASGLNVNVANQNGIIVGSQGAVTPVGVLNLAAVGQSLQDEADFASTGTLQMRSGDIASGINNQGTISLYAGGLIEGQGIVNTGSIEQGTLAPSVVTLTVLPGAGTIHSKGITGSGSFTVNNLVINDDNGNANNPTSTTNFLVNGLNIVGNGSSSAVTITLNANGSGAQAINLNISGAPTLFSNVNTPLNATSAPVDGGSSLLIQATGAININGGLDGASDTNHGDFTFPGGVALVSPNAITVNASNISNAWTSATGKPFQGVYLQAPGITLNNTKFVISPSNWVNFSSQPNELPAVQSWVSGTLKGVSGLIHQNQYTQLVQAAAAGQNWQADVDTTAISVLSNFLNPIVQGSSSATSTTPTTTSSLTLNLLAPATLTSSDFTGFNALSQATIYSAATAYGKNIIQPYLTKNTAPVTTGNLVIPKSALSAPPGFNLILIQAANPDLKIQGTRSVNGQLTDVKVLTSSGVQYLPVSGATIATGIPAYSTISSDEYQMIGSQSALLVQILQQIDSTINTANALTYANSFLDAAILAAAVNGQ